MKTMKKGIMFKMLTGVTTTLLAVAGIAGPMTIGSNQNTAGVSVIAGESIRATEMIADARISSDETDIIQEAGAEQVVTVAETAADKRLPVTKSAADKQEAVAAKSAADKQLPAAQTVDTASASVDTTKRDAKEQAAAEKAAAEQAAAEKAAAEQAAAEKAEAERLAAEQAEAERLETEKEALEASEIISSVVIIEDPKPVIKKIIHWNCYCGADFTDEEAFKQHAAEGVRRGEIHNWHNWVEEVEVYE